MIDRNTKFSEADNSPIANGSQRRGPTRARRRGFPGAVAWNRLRRRLGRKESSRTEQSILPLLIKVFAGFTVLDGRVEQGEVDSILGFLRYDYPETIYSELRQLFIDALVESHDLEAIASELGQDLTLEDKVLLGVQLYVLISRAGVEKENLITFYQFMTSMGVASEAVGIVYQLNASHLSSFTQASLSPADQEHRLETVIYSSEIDAGDVRVSVSGGKKVNIAVFRFQNLVLLKNLGEEAIIARGRQVTKGEFCRVYEGQRVIAGEDVFSFADLVFFFNAKKNVSSVQLYLAQDSNGAQFIEKNRTKQSYLKVIFGLTIKAEVLNPAQAQISNRPLIRGDQFEVSAREHIDFKDHSSITFAELRRKAREMGGRFSLTPNRTEYLVSNNPDHLAPGDILVSRDAGGEILLRIRCEADSRHGYIEVLESENPISIEGEPMRGKQSAINDGDTVYLGDGQYLRCHFSEGIIEEERNVINTLKVNDISHSYDRKIAALDSISLAVQRGEMVCILGPSGCGKSTLLRSLAGQLKPQQGRVEFNGVNLYEELANLSSYIAFIPQDETFDPLLTVEENLDTAAAIRAPHFDHAERRKRTDSRMLELGLHEIRHRLAGDAQNKSLSGGQRRRLNAGMDMIGIADVFLFDEPTSGLSSKDSEHVLDTIRALTHNKITLVSIHQPSSRLFHMFDKAILLDKGGRLVFFGTPTQMLEYFNDARIKEGVSNTYPWAPSGEAATLPPDFIFDILETPLRDLGGDIIYEDDSRGNLVPARRFSPSFWNERFQTYRLLEEVNRREVGSETNQSVALQKTPQRPQANLHQDWVRFSNQFKRAFLSKLRNHTNLAATLLISPALALLMALVLRFSGEDTYTFQNAQHIPTYLFLTLVVALFLGLSNSAEEIIREKSLLIRERHYGFRVSGYIIAKYLSLGFFAIIQNIIFLMIADPILSIKGMFVENLFWMFATSMVGISAGLFVSSVVNNPKTASNLIPMIMIPNIILGGALIKYEEMNRDLRVVDQIANWFGGKRADEPSSLKVPGICHLMPLRWSYEGIIISHNCDTPPAKLTNYIEKEVAKYSQIPLDQEFTDDQDKHFRQIKDAKPIVWMLEGETPKEVKRKVHQIAKELKNGNFDPSNYRDSITEGKTTYTPEMLYRNDDLYNLFSAAEVERLDIRRKENPPNVFFGEQKYIFSIGMRTILLNAFAMLGFITIAFLALYISLKRQLKKV